MPRYTGRRLIAAAALVALAVPLTGVPSAGAGTFEQAKVVRVIDGDTIDVDRNHDGRIDARIRLLGIDSPEHGLCGFAAAAKALQSLLRHKTVELRSDRGRTGIMGRPERRVLVNVAGTMVDASTWMLERGWGVWMPRTGEITGSLQQHQAADRAAAAGLGWFDGTRCGAGPYAAAVLSMQAQYLADAAHVMNRTQIRNQEFIRIRNDGAEPVSIDGWTLRVGNDRRQRVPAGGAILPGSAVDIHVGFGTNTATDRYLGSSVPMLVNASIDGGRHLGSGSYLIDPENDIRAHMTWPCTLNCTNPSGGTLRLSTVMVDPPGPDSADLNSEYVAVTNEGAAPTLLGDYVLEIFPFVYEFPATKWLDPGQSVTVHGGSGRDNSSATFLGAAVPPLVNTGGRVLLRTHDAIVVDCFEWGNRRCPR